MISPVRLKTAVELEERQKKRVDQVAGNMNTEDKMELVYCAFEIIKSGAIKANVSGDKGIELFVKDAFDIAKEYLKQCADIPEK